MGPGWGGWGEGGDLGRESGRESSGKVTVSRSQNVKVQQTVERSVRPPELLLPVSCTQGGGDLAILAPSNNDSGHRRCWGRGEQNNKS